MNNYTLHEIVASILEHKNMTMPELAEKLEISQLQLAREIGKNKKINQEFLIKMFNILDVSLIDNTTNEKIKIHNIDEMLSDTMNNLCK